MRKIKIFNKAKKVIQTLLIALLTLGYLVTSSVQVLAGPTLYPALSSKDTLEHSESPWYTWNQSQEPWGTQPLGQGGMTIQQAGCWCVSASMMVAMAGVTKTPDGKDLTPATANTWAANNGGYAGAGFIPKAWVEGVSQGKLQLAEELSGQSFQAIKSKIEEGYYVMWFNGAHMVFCYGTKGDKIIILDPESWQFNNGKPQLEYLDSSLNMVGENGASIFTGFSSAQVYAFKGEKKLQDGLKVGEDWNQADNGKSSKDADKGEKKSNKSNGIGSIGGGYWEANEDDVPNMPKDRDYAKYEGNHGTQEWNDYVKEWQEKAKEDFKKGSEDSISVAKWREERDHNIKKTAIDKARKVYMLLGAFVIGFAVIFGLIYWLDRWNPFGIQIIEKVSKGRVRVYSGKDNIGDVTQGKVRIINDYTILVYIAIMTLIGVLILSGVLQQALNWAYQFITDLISHFKSK